MLSAQKQDSEYKLHIFKECVVPIYIYHKWLASFVTSLLRRINCHSFLHLVIVSDGGLSVSAVSYGSVLSN